VWPYTLIVNNPPCKVQIEKAGHLELVPKVLGKKKELYLLKINTTWRKGQY
jgi:hypothetical protein